ncbi:unnamed protein product [Cuscuta epithymum]|uniref:Uncharacterized protein n=1 Tax=Cuscuta epithymum TaxID=186058 RepID=A0AAV0DLT1_9ASTE|nr:unnamed protein product [Cuscuta epithymum]
MLFVHLLIHITTHYIYSQFCLPPLTAVTPSSLISPLSFLPCHSFPFFLFSSISFHSFSVPHSPPFPLSLPSTNPSLFSFLISLVRFSLPKCQIPEIIFSVVTYSPVFKSESISRVIAARIVADSEDETVSLRCSNKKLQSTSP